MRHWIERLPLRAIFWSALAAVTVLALIPWSRDMPRPFQWSDKLNHFAAFVVLAILMMSAYRLSAIRGVAFLTLYGALIEGIQAFLPWRSAEWTDLGVDLLAATAGVWLWKTIGKRNVAPGDQL